MFGVLIINVFSEMSIEGVKSTMSYLSGVDANPAIEASTIPLLTSVIIPTNEPLFSLVLKNKKYQSQNVVDKIIE